MTFHLGGAGRLAGAARIVTIVLVWTAFATSGDAAPEIPRVPEAPVRFEVTAQPITSMEYRDPTRVRFGELEFRGGLVLSASYKEFGGISALRVAADGERFVAVSDQGRWWRGRILYDGRRPIGIADSEMAPLLGPDGKPLGAVRWYDAESLADDRGTFYVGLERVEQIVRFNYGRDGLLARGEAIPVPPEFRVLTYNKSLECLVMVPKGFPRAGTLVAVTERSLDQNGNHRSFLIKDKDFERFTVKRADNYDVSDCAILPSAELLLLERWFTWTSGIHIRMRRIPLASIVPGAVVDGPVMAEFDLGYQVDNMEGVSVHQAADGAIVLTLISDDNFSMLQRTLLLQFTLVAN